MGTSNDDHDDTRSGPENRDLGPNADDDDPGAAVANDIDPETPLEEEDIPEELADVLSDPHGRYAVAYLRRNRDPIELPALAKGVVGLMKGEPPETVEDEVSRRVRTWLHHGHIPVLEDYGVVEYDPESRQVRLGGS
jgi:hypothetical protein